MKKFAGVLAAALALAGLAVSPAFAATTHWAFASGQTKVVATATCPAGTSLTGGGFQASDNARVTSSAPDWEGNSWTVAAVNVNQLVGDVSVSAAAMCV